MSGTAVRLPVTLAGPRVTLRRWSTDDAAALNEVVARNVEHLRPWMPWVAQEPFSLADRIALIEGWDRTWAEGGDAVYGIFLADQPIGGCGLHARRGPHGLEIGYWVDQDHTGRGIAREAAGILTDAALAVPEVTFTEIHHDKANAASRRVPESLGYLLVAETADAPTAPGEVGIDCAWRMDADRWLARAPVLPDGDA